MGYRSGSVGDQASSPFLQLDSRSSEDNPTFGLLFSVPLSDTLLLDVLVDRQEGVRDEHFVLFDPALEVPREVLTFHRDATVTYAHVGVTRLFGSRRLRPALSVAAGRTVEGGSVSGLPSISVGFGLRYDVGKSLFYRLDARAYWTPADSSLEEDLTQAGVQTGIGFRF